MHHRTCHRIINHVAHGDVTKTFPNNSKHVVIIAALRRQEAMQE
jgi:hypothetical protein